MAFGAEIKMEYHSAVLTVHILGEIDHHSAKGVRDAIDKEIYLFRPSAVTLDLGEVTFMDSSGLGLILGRVATAEKVGATVSLRNVSPRILRILNMAGALRVPGLYILKEKGEAHA